LTASASQIVNNTIVTKTGNYTTGSDYIQWGVTINPNRVRFTDIELTDALQAGLSLDTTSVRLYFMELMADGSLVKASTPMDPSTYEISYDETTRIFIFRILGTTNLPYRLEFTTDVTVERINVNNVITMNGSGTVNNAGSTAISVVVLDDGVSAGGGGIVGEIRIRKGASDQPELDLQGATFGIYNSFGRKVAEATTGVDGIAVFSNLGMKTYSIVELVAPYGYTIDPTPIKVRLTTTANIAEVEQLNDPITGSLTLNKSLLDYLGKPIQESRPFTLKVTGPSYPEGRNVEIMSGTPLNLDGLQLGEYTVVELGGEGYDIVVSSSALLSVENRQDSITVTNQEIRGTLILEKILQDASGNNLSGEREFEIKITGPSFPSGQTYLIKNGIPLTIEGILLGEYSVEELNATAYTVTISNPIRLTDDVRSATITITNREKQKLPHTGIGFDPTFYVAGSLMILLGILLRKSKVGTH